MLVGDVLCPQGFRVERGSSLCLEQCLYREAIGECLLALHAREGYKLNKLKRRT